MEFLAEIISATYIITFRRLLLGRNCIAAILNSEPPNAFVIKNAVVRHTWNAEDHKVRA